MIHAFQIALDRLVSRPTAVPNAARVERYMGAGMDLGPISVIQQQTAPGEKPTGCFYRSRWQRPCCCSAHIKVAVTMGCLWRRLLRLPDQLFSKAFSS